MSTATRQTKPVRSWRVKLLNRRVIVGALADGKVIIKWKKLDDGVPVATRVCLTREAALATAQLILTACRIKREKER